MYGVLILAFVAAAVATLALVEPRGGDAPHSPAPPAPSVISLPRDRNTQNALTAWNEAWEVNAQQGRATFTVADVGDSGSGLIVALANSWEAPSAGGVAVVLRDSLEAPLLNADEAVVARNRSYFSTMPYYSRPAFQSTTLLNHEIESGDTYVLEWNAREIVFGRARDSQPLLAYDRTETHDSSAIRYLAFGTYGVERLPQCAQTERCAKIAHVKVE